MAAVEITPVDMTAAGYNLTDSAGFATLVSGTGNGVYTTYRKPMLLVLKNDTGGASTFTIYSGPVVQLTNAGLTVPNTSISVATGKTYLVPVFDVFRSSTGTILIECSVAGKVLALRGF